MSLTDQDLQKIQAVMKAEHDLTRSYIDNRFQQERFWTKGELKGMEDRLTTKIEGVRTQHTEDHSALAKDVAPLRRLPSRVKTLEKSR